MGDDFSKPVKGAKIDIKFTNYELGERSPFPEYFPGDTIHGIVTLKLENPYKASSLSVGLIGVQEFFNLQDPEIK